MNRPAHSNRSVENASRLKLIATNDRRFAAANHMHPQKAQMPIKIQNPALWNNGSPKNNRMTFASSHVTKKSGNHPSGGTRAASQKCKGYPLDAATCRSGDSVLESYGFLFTIKAMLATIVTFEGTVS